MSISQSRVSMTSCATLARSGPKPASNMVRCAGVTSLAIVPPIAAHYHLHPGASSYPRTNHEMARCRQCLQSASCTAPGRLPSLPHSAQCGCQLHSGFACHRQAPAPTHCQMRLPLSRTRTACYGGIRSWATAPRCAGLASCARPGLRPRRPSPRRSRPAPRR